VNIHDQAVKPEIQIHTTVHPYVSFVGQCFSQFSHATLDN